MSKHIWQTIAVVALLALLVGGCGPAATPSGTEGPLPAETPAAEAPTAAAGPSEAKVATFIMWQDFIDMDPAYAFASEQVVLNQCYENLVWMNPPGSEELLSPGLATSWEANEDATEWTFHLREGVTFQDGAPFNADAVKATMDHYAAAGGAGCSWIWGILEDVEVVDEYTVKMTCSQPTALDLIASGAFCGGMISPNVVDEPKEWFDAGHCVGTGPYTIESFDKGQRLIMSRFDDYWQGWQDNQFDKLVYEIVQDTVTQLQMVEAGEADVWRHLPPDKIEELKANPNLNVYIGPSYEHMQFLLNTQKPPLDDKMVRQALAYSFPYDQLLERSQGVFVQSRGAVPAAYWGHCDDCFQYQYDPEKAKELLTEAGYPDGIELELTYTADAISHAWPTELWVYPASEIGIKLDTRGMTYSAMWEYNKQDPSTAQDITIQHWWPTYVTPYDPLFSLYHSEDTPLYNLSYYRNPEFDALIDEGNRLSGIDREAATEKFIEAQEILVEDCPAIWVMDIQSTAAIAKDIEGFVDNPAYSGTVFFHDLTTTR
jgi:peptide/nickel transport system substrate-binding protein